MKLNTRLLIFIAGFSVLFLSSSAIVYQKSYNALNERISIDASLVASRINKHLQSQVNFIEEDMRLFTVANNLEGFISESNVHPPINSILKKRFISFFEREYGYKIYENIIIYDMSGRSVASALPQIYDKHSSWGKSLKDETSLGLIQLKNGKSAVSTIIALRNDQGEVYGLMQGITPLSVLIHDEDISLSDLGVNQVDILTKDGRILYSTILHKPNEKFKDQDLFQELKHGGEKIVKTADGEELFIVSKNIEDYLSPSVSWTLLLHMDYKKLFSKVLVLRWWIGTSVFIFIILSLVFFIAISRAIGKPLVTISDIAQKIGEGRLSERISGKMPSDFDVLINVFNSMAENIQTTQEQLEGQVRKRTKHLLDSNTKLLKEIEERRIIQNELAQSESRLKDAQQLAGMGYWIWDIATGEVSWSDEVYAIFHLSPEEFSPNVDSIMALSPWPEENSRDKELLERVVDDHTKGEYEQKFLRPDGSLGYYYSSFQGEYDENGELQKIKGTVVDITERKLAELAFRETSAILQAAMDCSPAGIAIADAPDGRLRYVNKAGLGISKGDESQLVNGVKIEDYVSRWNIFHFDGTPYVPEDVPLAQALMYGETVNEQFILRRPNLEERTVWAHAAPVYNNEVIVAAVVVFTDITDAIKAEMEIKKSEALLKLAAQSSGLALWEYRSADNKIIVSDYLYTIRGITPEEWDGSLEQACKGLHPEDEPRIMEEVGKVRNGSTDKLDIEYRLKRKDGSWGWEHVIAKVTERSEDNDILQVMGSLKDVTGKKDIEQQFALARKMESVGQLAAGIAHEINTPLHYIRSNLRFIDSCQPESEDNLNTEEKELRNEISSAIRESVSGVDHISNIVNAMKQFSHPGGTGIVKVDLNEIVKSVVTISRNEWKYVARIELSLDDSIPLPTCHPGEINQVVLNLIVNAAHSIAQKYDKKPDQGLITISTGKVNGNHVSLSIEDNGAGIPSDIVHRIFDPFFTTKEVGQGTGQGLSIAYTIIEKHNGSMTVDSVNGEGAKFTIKLPVV